MTTTRMKRCLVAAVTVSAALCAASVPSGAQTRPAAPAAGEAPTPRMADGHPDLSGVFFAGAEDPDAFVIKGRFNTKFSGPEEKPAYRPWALEKIKLIGKDLVANPNLLGCPPPGAPGFFFKQGQPIRFVQTPKELIHDRRPQGADQTLDVSSGEIHVVATPGTGRTLLHESAGCRGWTHHSAQNTPDGERI